ncbi:MAG: hypothetical protein ACTTJE_04885 [Schwartzia sp. (in: firmicutes)]
MEIIPQDADTIATEADLNAHRLAMEEYTQGKTISHDAIDWD